MGVTPSREDNFTANFYLFAVFRGIQNEWLTAKLSLQGAILHVFHEYANVISGHVISTANLHNLYKF